MAERLKPEHIRFWGKYMTSGKDYFVIELKVNKDFKEEIQEHWEERGTGVNELSFYVTTDCKLQLLLMLSSNWLVARTTSNRPRTLTSSALTQTHSNWRSKQHYQQDSPSCPRQRKTLFKGLNRENHSRHTSRS